ncbi:MAG: DUF4389 domain-containing protein [Armatimonadetes bacterium]|nr:DUF4389 domain-containing protein [Armatimonadota bacterium]
MEAASFPLTFDVAYPQKLSRWLIFVKWLLAIPHFLILSVLNNVQGVLAFIAFFAILFTRRYPRGLFDFMVGASRWNANVAAYFGLLRDEYPPFDWAPGKYPVTYEVAYPETLSRWLVFVKWLLLFPHYLVLWILYVAALIVAIVAWFAILFTAQYPRGMFDFQVGVTRWSYRVLAYFYLLRDEYPPFTLS